MSSDYLSQIGNAMATFKRAQDRSQSDYHELLDRMSREPNTIIVVRLQALKDGKSVGELELLRAPGQLQWLTVGMLHCEGTRQYRPEDGSLLDLSDTASGQDHTPLPDPPPGMRFVMDAVFWTTIEDAKVIVRNPDGMQLDPTAKAVNGGIPWCFIVGEDGNKKTCLWGTSLLGTGEKRRNFAWLLTVLLYVYGKAVMRRVKVTVTDGDDKIYEPIDDAIAAGQLGGLRARCLFHLFFQWYLKCILPGASEAERSVHERVRVTITIVANDADDDKGEVEEAFSKIFEFLAELDSTGQYSGERIETMRQKLQVLKVLDHPTATNLLLCSKR
jgi:hypothetical protein